MALFRNDSKVIHTNQIRIDKACVITQERNDEATWWDSYQDSNMKSNYEKLKKDDKGFLVGRAVVTTIGVYPYINEDGTTIRELRSPKEVYHPDSLETLRNVPITNDHPSVKVDSTNVKEYQVGNVSSNIWQDQMNGVVSAPLTIQEEEAVDDVENKGKRGLSCGYKCDVVMGGGVWNGIEYDAKQTNIRYNHLAIVDEGRAGDDAKLKMDALNGIKKINHVDNTNKQGAKEKMEQEEFKIDGITCKSDKRVKEHLDKAQEQVVALETKIDAAEVAKKEQDKALEISNAKSDTLQVELDKANAQLENSISKDDIAAHVASKVALDGALDAFKIDGAKMDVKASKVAIILAHSKIDASEKTDAYIDACYDMALASIKKDGVEDIQNDTAIAKVLKPSEEVKVDSLKDAEARFDAKQKDAWKK